MGRKPKPKVADIQTPTAPVLTSPGGIVEQTLALARWQRLAFVASIALATTLLMTPVVDNLYVNFFFSLETRILPSLVSTGAGLLVYAVGYWLVIGHVGVTPPVRKATFWYLVGGLTALGLVLILVIIGVYTNVFTGN